MTIQVYAASEGGFMFDVYIGDHEIDINKDTPVDGGHCSSGKLADAIAMAAETAKDYARVKNIPNVEDEKIEE